MLLLPVVRLMPELGPKAIAIRRTLPTALWTARPLDWFCRLSFPFIWLLNWSAQWLLRQIGIEPVKSTPREYGALIREETARMTKLIREAGITDQ